MSSRPHIREFLDATETITDRAIRLEDEKRARRPARLADIPAIAGEDMQVGEELMFDPRDGKLYAKKPRPAGAFPPMPEPKP